MADILQHTAILLWHCNANKLTKIAEQKTSATLIRNEIAFVCCARLHQFNSHLWHVLFVWCVRWSSSFIGKWACAAFDFFFVSFCDRHFFHCERWSEQKVAVIYINRLLLLHCIALSIWRLAGDFIIDFTTLTNSRRLIFFVDLSDASTRWRFSFSPPSLMHMEFVWDCELDWVLSSPAHRHTSVPETYYLYFIFRWKIINFYATTWNII